MPARVPEKVKFLNGELTGLKSRINGSPNAVQREKLGMFQEIRDDYQASLDRCCGTLGAWHTRSRLRSRKRKKAVDELSHYILPEGNVQIAFSGGRTSAYMLHQILEANGGLRDDVVVSFQNTGREMPQTLDFVSEVGARWGVRIVWLEYRGAKPLFEVVSHNSASRNGEPFDQLLKKKQALPNQMQKFCSAELKTKTAKRYLVSIGWKSWKSFVGFRADEPHRDPYQDNRSTGLTPLRDAGVSKYDVVRFWRKQPFDLRLPIARNKTVGGNCDGCFLKSEAVLSALSRDMPERHEWWENWETGTGHKFSKRYSRKQIREFIEKQGDWVFSKRGVLCQANGGECVA